MRADLRAGRLVVVHDKPYEAIAKERAHPQRPRVDFYRAAQQLLDDAELEERGYVELPTASAHFVGPAVNRTVMDTRHWYHCSVCDRSTPRDFCPKCGKPMVEPLTDPIRDAVSNPKIVITPKPDAARQVGKSPFLGAPYGGSTADPPSPTEIIIRSGGVEVHRAPPIRSTVFDPGVSQAEYAGVMKHSGGSDAIGYDAGLGRRHHIRPAAVAGHRVEWGVYDGVRFVRLYSRKDAAIRGALRANMRIGRD